jgi:hypothetical protein
MSGMFGIGCAGAELSTTGGGFDTMVDEFLSLVSLVDLSPWSVL